MQYTNGFKARMVQRLAGPERISATALSKEVGVSQATLSRWLRQASTVAAMGGGQRKREGGAKSPRQWTAEEKLRVLNEAGKLSEDELGALRKDLPSMTTTCEWCNSLSIAALARRASPKSGAHSSKARLEVTIMDPRS